MTFKIFSKINMYFETYSTASLNVHSFLISFSKYQKESGKLEKSLCLLSFWEKSESYVEKFVNRKFNILSIMIDIRN